MKNDETKKEKEDAHNLKRPYRRWTSEDKKTLKKLFPTMMNVDVAHEMGRPLSSVISQAFKMRLKKKPTFRTQIGRINIAKRWGSPRGK
jgi:hypothetical protein